MLEMLKGARIPARFLSTLIILEFGFLHFAAPAMGFAATPSPRPSEVVLLPAHVETSLVAGNPVHRSYKAAAKAQLDVAPFKTLESYQRVAYARELSVQTKALAANTSRFPQEAKSASRAKVGLAALPEDTSATTNSSIPRFTKVVTVTAYSSTPDQTDASPCTTANGYNVCEHGAENVVATNALPFGTKVRFPEYFGDKVFVVQDRMNRRYTDRMDVWMKSRESAMQFGKRQLKAEIL